MVERRRFQGEFLILTFDYSYILIIDDLKPWDKHWEYGTENQDGVFLLAEKFGSFSVSLAS